MENFLYFAEWTVETGDDGESEAICIPASSYIGADPVSATLTYFYFKNALGDNNGIFKVLLIHTSGKTKEVMKGMMRCINATPHSGGFVVVADSENALNGIATTHSPEFNPVFGGDVTRCTILEEETGGITGTLGGTSISTSYGAGMVSTGDTINYTRVKVGKSFVSTVLIDLQGLANKNDVDDVIGLAAGGAAYFFKNVPGELGAIHKIEMTCLEQPAGTNAGFDIDLRCNSSATAAYDDNGSGFTSVIAMGGDMTYTDTFQNLTDHGAGNDYFYLTTGATHTGDSTYTAGKLMVKFYSQPYGNGWELA